ncbi:MAG TPA: hypothetical protein VI455_06270 [Terriglobia bacterium]
MVCQICQKRKANRFCPAKSQSICSVCCATEREVSIDCPSDCPHLVDSRQYEEERRQVDWSNLPFAEVRIEPSVFRDHENLLDAIAVAICDFAGEHRELVDSDVIAALQNLAEAYRTLVSGIYYEKALDYPLQRELCRHLKDKIAAYQKEVAAEPGFSLLRDATVRDALILLTQIGTTRTNGRPKGRAYLDFLRREFNWRGRAPAAGSGLVILP